MDPLLNHLLTHPKVLQDLLPRCHLECHLEHHIHALHHQEKEQLGGARHAQPESIKAYDIAPQIKSPLNLIPTHH